MKLSQKLAVLFTGMVALMGTAHAEVPAIIQTAFDSAAADATSVLGIVAGAIVTLIGGYWLIAMVKRGKSA